MAIWTEIAGAIAAATEAPFTLAREHGVGGGCINRAHVLEGAERQLQKLGSAGRPVLSYEIRVVDAEGKDISVGEVGEIIVKSEAMMKGYWKLPRESAKGMDCPDWR